MKPTEPAHQPPVDADDRRNATPVICYQPDTLQLPTRRPIKAAPEQARKIETCLVPPREARCLRVNAGSHFRIVSVDGPQVGDLNLWAADNLGEHFYSGKTRALHGTHLSTGDAMWSCFPYLRPMAIITDDTLDWYGFDADGGSVHDVIGTRCDPYTEKLLTGRDYDHCCHSNLTRALAGYLGTQDVEAETHVHDVLNVFMCTGFLPPTYQYFMKASPVRPGDYLEFHAEIDLLVGLSACPGGDCGQEHSSDTAPCYPLLIEVYETHAQPEQS